MRAPDDALLARAGVASTDLASLLALIGGTDVVELDVTVGATRLSVRRAIAPTASFVAQHDPAAEEHSLAITSPLVGIFRTALAVGDSVEAGQPIGAVEALGLPTHVDAPHGGTVENVLVADGQAVEYGQALLVLHRAADHAA